MPDDPNWGEQPQYGNDPQWGTNPFQTPQYGDAGPDGNNEDQAPRSGPAWERDGASFNSFVQTVQDIFSDPKAAFYDMRPEGGIGAPLVYAIIGTEIGVMMVMFVQLVFHMLGVGAAFAGMPGQAGNQVAMSTAFSVVICLGILILAPLFIALRLLISSAIVHLFLLMLGGSKYGFETTLRVLAYSSGTTSLILLIPLCGQYIQGIVQIVYAILGISSAHEVSGLRATGAVLLPMVVCCFLIFGLFAALIGLGVAAAAGAR